MFNAAYSFSLMRCSALTHGIDFLTDIVPYRVSESESGFIAKYIYICQAFDLMLWCITTTNRK